MCDSHRILRRQVLCEGNVVKVDYFCVKFDGLGINIEGEVEFFSISSRRKKGNLFLEFQINIESS